MCYGEFLIFVIMLTVIMLSLVMLSVIMLSVVILSVVAPSEGKLICISIDSTLILLHPGNAN